MNALCGLDIGFLQPRTAVLLYAPCSLYDRCVSSSSQSPLTPTPGESPSDRYRQDTHITKGLYWRASTCIGVVCTSVLPPSWRAQLMSSLLPK